MNEILHFILKTQWISWIIHFFMFLILIRFSGIKLSWALLLVIAIELWEMSDWSFKDPLRWWRMPDTYIDILSGLFGIAIAYLWLKRSIER